jgi:hypothetical protein
LHAALPRRNPGRAIVGVTHAAGTEMEMLGQVTVTNGKARLLSLQDPASES